MFVGIVPNLVLMTFIKLSRVMNIGIFLLVAKEVFTRGQRIVNVIPMSMLTQLPFSPVLQRPYICDYPGCTKRYTDPSSLRKHKNNSHLKKARCDGRPDGEDGGGVPQISEVVSSSKGFQKLQRPKQARRSSSSAVEGIHMMETSTMMEGSMIPGAMKQEAMYHPESSELPFMKAHTDPGPAALQRVRNSIGSYLLCQEDPQYSTDRGDYTTYYLEADQKQISTGGGGVALPVIQHSSWGHHSASPPTAEYPHQPPPTLNQLSNYSPAPMRTHLLTRTRSNGNSVTSNGTFLAPSPAESMLSSASIETARTNHTYPGTKRVTVNNATFTPSLRNHSAVATGDRQHNRHHSYPTMSGVIEQQRNRPLQRNLSQGNTDHGYFSRHNLLPPLQSNKALGYELCDALPSFSDVQSTSSCSMDTYRLQYSANDMAPPTHQPEYVTCQPPVHGGHEQLLFDGSVDNGSHIMHLPSYSEAMRSRGASSNMVLGDRSTHIMSLSRETSFLEGLHSRHDIEEGLF